MARGKLSPTQKSIYDALQKGKTATQIAKSRKTSTNAVHQAVRRIREAGYEVPNNAGNGGSRGNGGGRRQTRRAAARRPDPVPPLSPEQPAAVVDPKEHINSAKEAVEAERLLLAKTQDNAMSDRERLLAEAEAAGQRVEALDGDIARLDQVIAAFDAPVPKEGAAA